MGVWGQLLSVVLNYWQSVVFDECISNNTFALGSCVIIMVELCCNYVAGLSLYNIQSSSEVGVGG